MSNLPGLLLPNHTPVNGKEPDLLGGVVDDALPTLREGRFSGLEAFQQGVRGVLSLAGNAGWKEIILSDADFVDWPLGERALVQHLQDWAKMGRKLVLVANDFRRLQRDMPRFVRWRQTWDHLLECRRCVPGAGGQAKLPSAIWTPEWMLHHFEGDRFDGYLGRDPARRLQLREGLLSCIKSSSPGFPATTLGL